MKGASAELWARTRSKPKRKIRPNIGIIHHSFCRQRNSKNSAMMPNRSVARSSFDTRSSTRGDFHGSIPQDPYPIFRRSTGSARYRFPAAWRADVNRLAALDGNRLRSMGMIRPARAVERRELTSWLAARPGMTLALVRGGDAGSDRQNEVRMVYGREKAWGETDWRRRIGYWLFGELHIPGRLRSWHIIRALRRLGLWDAAPRALYDAGGGEGAFAFHVARRFPAWRVVIGDNEARTIERALRIKRALGLDNLEVRDVDLREPGEAS